MTHQKEIHVEEHSKNFSMAFNWTIYLETIDVLGYVIYNGYLQRCSKAKKKNWEGKRRKRETEGD